ncbi:MAG: MoaD/ThiS family protein [Chloroflexota bacterium]
MLVTVRLYGNLRKHLPPGQERIELELTAGATVHHVLEAVGIDRGEVGLVTVGDRVVSEDLELWPGAAVDIFAIIGGG